MWLIELLKNKGYIIIHDEFKNHNRKINFIKNKGYEILYSIILDHHTWWDDYYKYLDEELSLIENREIIKLFKSDLKEINRYKKESKKFISVYYLISNSG